MTNDKFGFWILSFIWILSFGFWISDNEAAFAQTAFDPLSIAVGARALGMGQAGVALTEDADTLFNNPAGLGEIDSLNFTSMGGILLEDVSYTLLGGIFPLGKQSAVGVGFAEAFVSGIEIRDSTGILSRKANYGNAAALIAFGRKVTEKTSLGLSLKYYFTDGTEIDDGDSKGWNADIGILQKGLDWLSFGLVVQNLSGAGKINYQNGESDPLPRIIKAGTKMYLLGSGFGSAVSSPLELSAVFDARFNLQETRPMTAHGGIEFSPSPFLTLRGGFAQDHLAAGLTLRLAGLGFHYAYDPFAKYFSITFDERGWPPEGQPDVYFGCKDLPAMIK